MVAVQSVCFYYCFLSREVTERKHLGHVDISQTSSQEAKEVGEQRMDKWAGEEEREEDKHKINLVQVKVLIDMKNSWRSVGSSFHIEGIYSGKTTFC